jgi:hypothetical protein
MVLRIVECHPPQCRPSATAGATCGLRQGEIIHVRRQVKKLGKEFVFALPKTERTVPMSE